MFDLADMAYLQGESDVMAMQIQGDRVAADADVQEWLQDLWEYDLAEETQPLVGVAEGELSLSRTWPAAVMWIEAQKKELATWRYMLHGHMMRGKQAGGPIIDGGLFVFLTETPLRRPGATCDTHHATLRLPDSHDRGDGWKVHAEAERRTKSEAAQQVCKEVLIELLLRDAAHFPESNVCLSPKTGQLESLP